MNTNIHRSKTRYSFLLLSFIIVLSACNTDEHLREQTLIGEYYTFMDPWYYTMAAYIRTEDGVEYCLTGYPGGDITLYNYHKDTLYSKTFQYDFYPYDVPVFEGDTIIIIGDVTIHKYKGKEYYLLGGQTYLDIIGRGEKYNNIIKNGIEYQLNHPEEFENRASHL